MKCTREFFTHGGRATRQCGSTDSVVECSECHERFCGPCQQDKPVFNLHGQPVCEDCVPLMANLPLWE